MVAKRNVRAFIDAVKERTDVRDKVVILSLINYYLGGVTKKDFDEVRGK